jgi:glycosyltransferase involved in cell wall biosynthesis
MTLWVRDEIDIIEHNINFHLKQGVDFIIASDNGSKDGTREVLEKYEIKGVLRLLDDPRQDHSQALCVNKMGRMARDEYGADYVFHCDADEFWHPKSGDLKNEISASDKEALKATVINVLLLDKNGQETFPQDTRYAVVRPIIPYDYVEESKRVNLFFFRYLPSVIFKGYHEVSRGNHTVTDIPESEIGRSKDIIIYHYPLRNKKRFYQRVINKGKAYQANKILKKNEGFNNKRWYEAYKKGELDKAYRELIFNDHNIPILTEKGMIKEFCFDELMKEESCCL